MTIREEYNKAYRNYLRRFNNQLQQGFDIPKIERVKRPTRASINRLNRQTAPVLRSSAQRIFDFSEGISYRTKGLKRRYIEEIVKSNREYRADYPEYFKKTPDYSRFDKRPDKINLIISNWMQTIRKLNEPVDEHIAPFFLYQVSTRVLTSDINKIKLAFENILTPISTVLSTLHTAVQTTFTTIGAVYDEHVKPMFDAFKTGISEIVSTLLDGFNTYIAPVLQSLASEFSVVWTESIQPAINEIIKLVGNIATLVKDLWKTQLQPFINWLSSYVGPLVAPLIDGMGQAFLDLLSTVGKVVKGVTQALNGVLTFLDSIFPGDWEQCWEGVKETFTGIWTAFSGIAEGAMNAINTIFSPVSEWFGELFGEHVVL